MKDQELDIIVNIAAKQEETKDCCWNKKDGETINQKDDSYPDKRDNPYGLNHCLNPERVIDLRILMPFFWKKHQQQTQNGENSPYFINGICLDDRKVSPLAIETCNSKHFRNQPGGFVSGEIGV